MASECCEVQKGRRKASGFALAAAATCGIVLLAWRSARGARSAYSQTQAREVAVVRNGVRDALEHSDAIAFAENYADGAAARSPGGIAIKGARSVEAAMRSAFASGSFENVALEADRRVHPGIVFESGTYSFTFSTERRGDVRFAGRFVALWKREGTRWKIVFEAAHPAAA